MFHWVFKLVAFCVVVASGVYNLHRGAKKQDGAAGVLGLLHAPLLLYVLVN
jgi:hypothetical protein